MKAESIICGSFHALFLKSPDGYAFYTILHKERIFNGRDHGVHGDHIDDIRYMRMVFHKAFVGMAVPRNFFIFTENMVAAAKQRTEDIYQYSLFDEEIYQSSLADQDDILLGTCQRIFGPIGACCQFRRVECMQTFRRCLESNTCPAVNLYLIRVIDRCCSVRECFRCRNGSAGFKIAVSG